MMWLRNPSSGPWRIALPHGVTSSPQANGQQVVYGNPGSPHSPTGTGSMRGVPVADDVHSTGGVQFKVLSFTFK